MKNWKSDKIWYIEIHRIAPENNRESIENLHKNKHRNNKCRWQINWCFQKLPNTTKREQVERNERTNEQKTSATKTKSQWIVDVVRWKWMHVLHILHRSTRPAFQASGRTTTTTKYIKSNAVRKSTQQTAPYATPAAAPPPTTKTPHNHKQYKINWKFSETQKNKHNWTSDTKVVRVVERQFKLYCTALCVYSECCWEKNSIRHRRGVKKVSHIIFSFVLEWR